MVGRARPLALSALAASLLLAGCGGGGGGGGDQLTHEELGASANKICNDGNDKVKNLDQPQTLEELATYSEDVKKVADDEVIPRMKDLKAPDEDADALAEYIGILEEQSGRLDDVTDAAKAGDEDKVNELGRDISEAEKRSDALARSFGADDCAD
jgi:hypothetical protein